METSVRFMKLYFTLLHMWCLKECLCKIRGYGYPLTACQRKLSYPAVYCSYSERICRVISDVMLQHTKIITNNFASNIVYFISVYVERSKSLKHKFRPKTGHEGPDEE